jgi:hypothetical protein
MLCVVVRLLYVLAALGGCNVVLGLDHVDAVSQACGPYGEAVPVALSPLLGSGAHDLSVADDGISGAVVTDVDATSLTHPVTLDDTTMTWGPDTSVSTNVLDTVRGHRITADTILATPPGYGEVDVYQRFASGWAATGMNIDHDQNFEFYAGTERDVYDTMGNLVDRTVTLVKRRTMSLARSQIVVTSSDARDINTFAEELSRTAPLNAQTGLQPTHAVMTDDRRTIVYAATLDNGTSSVFETTFDETTQAWQPGTAVVGVDKTGAEDEPWINADCSRIWFRRNGVVYQADKQ